jgi:protein disulfide-isomerase A6
LTGPQCVIANLDADAAHNKGIASEYGVSSYPTIKFFPRSTSTSSSQPPESNQSDTSKGNKTPIPYEDGRSEADFVKFLNEHCGTNRAVGGGLNDLAGLVPQLESHVLEFFAAAEDKKQAVIASVQAEVAKLEDDAAKAGAWYVRALAKSLKDGEAWVEKEHKRSVPLTARSWLAS